MNEKIDAMIAELNSLKAKIAEESEPVRAFTRANGLIALLEKVQDELVRYALKHSFRKNFSTLAQGTIQAIIEELKVFEYKYEYVAGKEE